jgi:hypothetical protein
MTDQIVAQASDDSEECRGGKNRQTEEDSSATQPNDDVFLTQIFDTSAPNHSEHETEERTK